MAAPGPGDGDRSPNSAVAPVTKDTIKAAAECWNRVGEATAEFGVRTTGHHEFFCAIRTEEDILSFYEWTDPRYVSFFCDTAQHCIAGIDPVALYEQLHDRCSGFHFKDTREVDTTRAFTNRPDAELMAPQTARWFYEMGTEGGLVDFPRLMRALAEHQFTGWITEPGAQCHAQRLVRPPHAARPEQEPHSVMIGQSYVAYEHKLVTRC